MREMSFYELMFSVDVLMGEEKIDDQADGFVPVN